MLHCTRGIQGFFSFANKARSTTLTFVECITFNQTNLLYDVHKILAVFIDHKLRILYLFEYTTHIMKHSRFDLN